MKYKFCLRNTETGDVKIFHDGHEWSDENLMLFQWMENNFACDCNRAEFLYEDDPDWPCSDGRISIDWIRGEDGTKVNINGTQG